MKNDLMKRSFQMRGLVSMEILLLCLAAFFGIGGVVHARNIYLALVSKRWAICQATVVDVKVEADSDDGFLRFHPHIQYKYNYHGKTYHGDRYEFGKRRYTKSELNYILYQYVAGGEIEIRVNPGRPRISVVKTGTELVDYIILFGVLWLFVFVLSEIV